MADDPNRDILPVKDDSCSYGSIKCFSDIDPRERHIVCKLDRYQLEDRYLRLLEEVQTLKKLSNSQEDKIKRLATKLMRSAASSRICPAVLTANQERERIAKLELENTRLKEKTYTLKNQLLSHRGPRSPSRCRHVQSGVSSGPTTYRSESARTKYQPPQRNEIDDNDAQNYLVKIEELETERNEMMTRIADLESQITVHMAGIQREKVQENVEYIRMWRQMKQANDKLISVQTTNETLHSQIGDLKRLIEETTKNNREVTAALVSEKERISELDEQITSAKDSQLSLREKDEQIRNLRNEMKILQQHNDELITLSSKFGQVELENVELKRKLGESAMENQSLRATVISEQASQAALRAANDKLIEKLEELQRNADSLTVQQLVQNKEKKRLVSKGLQTEIKSADKNVETSFPYNDTCSQRSDEHEQIISDETDVEECAEEIQRLRFRSENEFDRGKKKSETKNHPKKRNRSKPTGTGGKSEGKTKLTHLPSSRSMSRENILKLLDQAQINTPLETKNAARIRQVDVNVERQNDSPSKYQESYRDSETRSDDFTLTEIPSHELFDPKQVLLTLFKILKNYSDKIRETSTTVCSNEDLESSHSRDNNVNCDYKNLETNERENTSCEETEDSKEPILLNRFAERGSCECDSNHRYPLATSDCGYGCCPLETDRRFVLLNRGNLSSRSNPAIVKCGGIGEIGLTIREAFDSIYGRRDVICDCNEDCSDLWSEIKSGITNDQLPTNIRSPKIVFQEVERCKERLRGHSNKLNDDINCNKEKSISNDENKNRNVALNECGGDTSCTSAFPFLITKGQGLVEIHMMSLQLSAKATQTDPFKDNSGNISVFISWEIWDQETAFTPIAKYPSFNFNSSSVYRVSELQNFFDRVLREEISFQVNAIDSSQEAFVLAKAKLSVKDILDYPQNKLHYIAPVISVLPCSCGGNFGQLSLWIRLSCDLDLVEHFKDRCGLLTALPRLEQTQLPVQKPKEEDKSSGGMRKYTLSSSLNTLEDFYSSSTDAASREERRNTSENFTLNKSSRLLETISESVEPINEPDSKKNFFRNEEYYSADSNSSIKLKKDISIEGEHSASTSVNILENHSRLDSDAEMHTASSRELRLAALQKRLDSSDQIESESITEFNNLLKNETGGSSLRGTDSTADDLGTVIADDKWEEFKRNEERTSNGLPIIRGDSSLENTQDTSARKNTLPHRDTITITIATMNLFERTSLMNNPDVHLLYVEYTFLGMHGADMETVSLPKPKNKGDPMAYNFTRYFQVDEQYHNSQRNMLIAMLSGTANPKIRFVLVSEPLPEDVDTKECVEVGHADLNIREYALGDGLRNIPLIIMNPAQSEQFGILRITIDGIEIIRDCMMVQKRL